MTLNLSLFSYRNVGAVAQLYDISCLYTTPVFSPTFKIIQDLALKAWEAAPSGSSVEDAMPVYWIWAPYALGMP